MAECGRLDRGDGVELAWARTGGRGPTVVFLHGFNSDMTGEKALAVEALCAARGRAMLRFDYSGHGASGGRFVDGTVGRWAADAMAAIAALTEGPLLLVGSSMGGWIALLAALACPDRVVGLVGVAAAPDFTETLMWERATFEERTMVMDAGQIMVANGYGEPYPVTRALIEDGRTRMLLGRPIPLACPVRLLHGQLDLDVPWQTSLLAAERLTSTDVQVILVKDGDHRLSRPADLALLAATLTGLLEYGG